VIPTRECPSRSDIEDRINAIPARTIDGLRAKAQIIRMRLGDAMEGEICDPAGAIAFQIARDILQMSA